MKAQLLSKLTSWYLTYADPAHDGKGEAVRGKGQLGRAGVNSDGKTAFR